MLSQRPGMTVAAFTLPVLEPVMSVLTEAVKLIEPGRCVT
jgi:hypothetical protein